MGLFVLESSGSHEDAPAIEVTPEHGYNVATWEGDGLTYELVTDLDEAEIRRMVGAAPPSPYFVQPASLSGP